jgi:hypothetical protein
MTDLIFRAMKVLTYPLAKSTPLDSWGYWMGRFQDIKLYGKVKPAKVKGPSGSANINIVIDLIKETQMLDGDLAECGVFRGATSVSIA